MSYELALSLKIILLVLVVFSSLFIIFAVLKQPGNSNGTAITGNNNTDTFYGKNKAKRMENQLKKFTVVAGIVLAVCSILLFIVNGIQ